MNPVAILLLTTSSVFAADPTGIAFFEQKIRPVLVEHCYSCHSAQAKKLKGNLYLDSQAGWQQGGDSGESVVVPGKPEDSLLIRTVRHLEVGREMPPKQPKLPDAVIADLITWVKMGAPDPRSGVKTEAKRADKSWWSLQPLAKQFDHDKIDGFITAKLTSKGLTQNPPADPRSLIRRMSYDVTGLPPTPEEVDVFVAEFVRDPESGVRNLVDRLLASPRYGERWGRHWLDVVRFGESNGFERNFVIDDLWPFRDFVIGSFNDDKPFNQFIVEHLAGDVIGMGNPAIEVGSAFLVAGPYDDVGNQSVVAQKNIRAATLDDIITATSGAFLGLTINCARCHDHKFDPIPTEDYYRLRAAFEGTTHGRRVIATQAERDSFNASVKPLQQQKATLSTRRDALNTAIEERAKAEFAKRKATLPKIDVHGTSETFPPIQARLVRFVIHALTTDYNPRSPKGARAGRLTEFEVWSAESTPRNVALTRNGGMAEGAQASTAEDFPAAYGPQLCIDGQSGEQWFIGTPEVLTITLAKPEVINRITFANSKGRDVDESRVRGGTPCEYEVQVSRDGKTWVTVASDEGREPWTPAHGVERARRELIAPEETNEISRLKNQIDEVQQKLNAVPKLREYWVGNHSQPKEPTFVHQGGDPLKPGDQVVPASLQVLDRATRAYSLNADAPENQRRLALARWIAHDDNPLTPRVLANRLWQYHFGTGIVETPSDFGFLGSQPTHPELLDYLARRLLANGWRIKPLHREILLSQTYRQSSTFRADAARNDKDARLLWRYPPRRLTAEEIRDTLLSVANKLQLDPMGGPGFRLYKFTQNNVCTYFPLDVHGPETYRRAVYHQNARASVVDVLNDFDLPDIAFAAPKRANTTTPLQALTLLNHGFTLDMARSFAARIETGDPIAQAFSLAFQRPPTTNERLAAEKLIATFGREAFCRALLNSNELIYID